MGEQSTCYDNDFRERKGKKMIVVAKLKAQSGKEAEMENVLKEMVGKVKGEEGTLAYTLHRSKKDPSVFMFYEKYKDKEALDFHSSTPHFKEMSGILASIVDGPLEIDVYDELASL
jgi:quinol monooxygenase YgiN